MWFFQFQTYSAIAVADPSSFRSSESWRGRVTWRRMLVSTSSLLKLKSHTSRIMARTFALCKNALYCFVYSSVIQRILFQLEFSSAVHCFIFLFFPFQVAEFCVLLLCALLLHSPRNLDAKFSFDFCPINAVDSCVKCSCLSDIACGLPTNIFRLMFYT